MDSRFISQIFILFNVLRLTTKYQISLYIPGSANEFIIYCLLKRYKTEFIYRRNSITIKSESKTLFVDKKGYIGLFLGHFFISFLVK